MAAAAYSIVKQTARIVELWLEHALPSADFPGRPRFPPRRRLLHFRLRGKDDDEKDLAGLCLARRLGCHMKNFWLVKQESSSYSWSDFIGEGHTSWTGVRN